MTPKLTTEQLTAVDASGNGSIEVVHPVTNQTYFIVDGNTHRQAMDALRRQQDHDAIAEGIAQMEAGQTIPLEEARRLTKERLLARHQ